MSSSAVWLSPQPSLHLLSNWSQPYSASSCRGHSQLAPPAVNLSPFPPPSSISTSPPLSRSQLQSQLPTPPLAADSSVFSPAFIKAMPAASRRPAGRVSKSIAAHSGDTYDLDLQSRSARSTRRNPKSTFHVNSGDESFDESEGLTKRIRKRKRSESPPLSDGGHTDLADSCDSDLANNEQPIEDHDNELIVKISINELTLRVPRNHVGPLIVQLDATNAVQSMSEGILSPASMIASKPRPKRSCMRNDPVAQTTPNSLDVSSKRAGFLDLPAELRNEIYRLTFTTGGRFNFASPKNFGRSTALLRTCHQVHEEARGILYSENEFYFARRTSRYGSFWEDEWRELGFRSIRKFLKSIGPKNTSLIKHISFQFEDATPCLNPDSMTHDERRFVNDTYLISILRHLAEHSKLHQFDMNFHGRRRVESTDLCFLQELRLIKADIVRFVPYPIAIQTAFAMESKQEESVRRMLLHHMTRAPVPRK